MTDTKTLTLAQWRAGATGLCPKCGLEVAEGDDCKDLCYARFGVPGSSDALDRAEGVYDPRAEGGRAILGTHRRTRTIIVSDHVTGSVAETTNFGTVAQAELVAKGWRGLGFSARVPTLRRFEQYPRRLTAATEL